LKLLLLCLLLVCTASAQEGSLQEFHSRLQGKSGKALDKALLNLRAMAVLKSRYGGLARLVLIDWFLTEKRYKEAKSILSYETGLQTSGDAIRTKLYTFRLAAGKGDRKQAIAGIDGMLGGGREEGLVDAAYHLGLIQEENDLKSAIKSYSYALNLFNDLSKDTYYVGFLTGSVIDSRLKNALQKQDELNKGEPRATYEKAQALQNGGRYAEAQQLYATIVREYAQHPLAHPSGYLIAECLRSQKKYREALKVADDFIFAMPDGPWRGQAHLMAGDILLDEYFDIGLAEWHYAGILYPGVFRLPEDGKKPVSPNGVFKPFDHLYDNNPNPEWQLVIADGCERLGLCLYMRRDFASAERYLGEELRLRQTKEIGGYKISSNMQMLLNMCRAKRSPVYFSQHVMQGDRRVQTILFLTSAYLEAGNTAKALSLLQRLNSEFKNVCMPVHQAYARMEEAEALRLSFRFDESINAWEAFEAKFANAPMAPMALMGKASVLMTLNRQEDAIMTYQRIYDRYPSSTEAVRAMYYEGFIYYAKNESEKALQTYQRLLTRFAGSWEAKRVQEFEIPELVEKLAGQRKGG
jgi:TolA-binding protein